jgi:hypothetical protein
MITTRFVCRDHDEQTVDHRGRGCPPCTHDAARRGRQKRRPANSTPTQTDFARFVTDHNGRRQPRR